MKISPDSNCHLAPMKPSRASFMPFTTSFARPRSYCGRTFVSLGLLSLMGLSSPSIPAQTTDVAQPAHRTTSHYKRPSLDEQVEVLAVYLDLDANQRATLKKILLQRQQEILQMRLAPSDARSSPSDRFRAIEDKTVERIRAALNDQQRQKYDPIGVRRLTPATQQSSVEGWLKATSPR
jgi:hypothetical protein